MTETDLFDCRQAAGLLRDGAEELGVRLSRQEVDAFAEYCRFLLERNQHVNLTAVRTPEGVATTLFLDSLTLLDAIPLEWRARALHLIDVGSGAGFPGVPLRIVCPQWSLTLVESIGKKATFLRDLARHLGLERVRVVAERAEDAGRSAPLRDGADLCVARAVAALPTLLELCAPLIRPGGTLVLPKSGDIDAELQSSEAAQRALNIPWRRTVDVPQELGLGEGRAVLVFEKTGATPPGYPRRVGLARSRPIGSSAWAVDRAKAG